MCRRREGRTVKGLNEAREKWEERQGTYSFWDGILEVLDCVFHHHPEPCLALGLASWS